MRTGGAEQLPLLVIRSVSEKQGGIFLSVMVISGLDCDCSEFGKALAISLGRWWQGFSLPPILYGYIYHLTNSRN